MDRCLPYFYKHYKSSVHALTEGLVNGFRSQYTGHRLPVFSKNLLSAVRHSDILQEKIDKEVFEGRVAGRFQFSPMHNLHTSPIGVVPKADGDWQMIMHLSHPPATSINHNVDPIHTSVKYTSCDTVVQTVRQRGRGAVIAKCDIKSAFRLLRVNPDDFKLLGLHFNIY